ncbi:hypothetical protein J6590_045569 [Homalodisca vitripennis]|nr:hypothetical protein J6590_045569 [Homalodisca vitripennis]
MVCRFCSPKQTTRLRESESFSQGQGHSAGQGPTGFPVVEEDALILMFTARSSQLAVKVDLAPSHAFRYRTYPCQYAYSSYTSSLLSQTKLPDENKPDLGGSRDALRESRVTLSDSRDCLGVMAEDGRTSKPVCGSPREGGSAQDPAI